MKKLFLIIIFGLTIIAAKSQTAYHDALSLKTLGNIKKDRGTGKLLINLDSNNISEITRIFRRYGEIPEGASEAAAADSIRSILSGNPFIITGTSVQQDGLGSDPLVFKNLLQAPASIGGLNVTNIADGVAQFLVARTKEELSLAFFKKFKKTIDDSEELKKLFPKTLAVLNVIDQDIYKFSNYLNTLREAFKKDLDNILVTLDSYIDEKKTALYVENEPSAQKLEYFQAALVLVNNIRLGNHPAEAIAALNNKRFDNSNTVLLELQEATRLFTVFSNSLKSNQSDRYWISSDSLKLLMDPVTFNIYLGLIYEKHRDEMFFGNDLKSYLDKVSQGTSKIEDYQNYLKSFIQESEKVELSIQSIKEKKKAGEKINSYNDIFISSTQLLVNLNKLSDIDAGISFSLNPKLVKVIQLLNDVYLDINEKQYSALILDVSLLLSELLNDFTWKDSFIKYGTFIANVAQAESPDEVQSAIEAIALPVGSASIKKHAKFNLSLNAYTGIFYGNEYLEDPNQGWADIYGVSAPIGIAASWPVRLPCKKLHIFSSFSLYGSLVDLGAVASYRFKDDDTESLPEIKLENIFAPGVYGVLGFKDIPVSLGYGWQQGPHLREVNVEDSANPGTFTNTTANGYRWSIFLAVDIPLTNFYTKSE